MTVFHLENWFEGTQGGEANIVWGRKEVSIGLIVVPVR